MSDEAIQTLLEKRAGQPDVAGRLAAARTVAAVTPQRQAGRFWWVVGRTPTLVGAAGLTAVVLVLVGVGLASRTPSNGSPTGSPLAASGSPGPNPSPLPSSTSGPIVLTVNELNGLIATAPGAVTDRELVIRGQIAIEGAPCAVPPDVTCVTGPLHLVGSSPDLIVAPLIGPNFGPPSQEPQIPFSGTFAATLRIDHTLAYHGRVSTSEQGGAFPPSKLQDPSSDSISSLVGRDWLVRGWISGLPPAPSCPSMPPPASSATPQYSCEGIGALLSDDPRQPVTVTSGGYSVSGGPGSVVVQNGAYAEFAPSPESQGLQSRPEEGTFLVQETYVSTCSAGELCALQASNFHWAVVARVDPLPVVAPAPSSSTTPTSQPVLPLTVEHLTALLATAPQTLSGRQLVITGELAYPGPVASCVGKVADCQARLTILGSQPAISVLAGVSASLPKRFPFRGTFVATVIDAATLQFGGIVTTAADGGPIVPTQLPPTWNATGAHPYWLVQGWIAGFDVAVSCAPVSAQPAGPQYDGCGVTSSLSDTAAQPVSGTSFNVPKDGVQVQDRAYDDFSPDPHLAGPGTVPELATFLVDQNLGPCPPAIYCSFGSGLHWRIVSRIDPWPEAAQP